MLKFLTRAVALPLFLLSALVAFPLSSYAAVNFLSLSNNGQSLTNVPPNEMCSGPAASQMQDCSLATTLAYTSGGCTTTPTVIGSAYGFLLTNGGAGCSGSTMVLTPSVAAANGWMCYFIDATTAATYISQTGNSKTTITLTNYTRTTGVALTWVASDVIEGACVAF